MTEREHDSLAAERVLSELERVSPERVIVPLRSRADHVAAVIDWLGEFDLQLSVLWCNGPRLEELLADRDLDGDAGKGRDVWLGIGQALESEFVVVHDADTKSYSRAQVPRLLFPLTREHSFVKGYYARVEHGRLYGRLFRLFYAPLVRTLADAHEAPVLDYLGAFRYALAGEFAARTDLAREFRPPRTWGLEVGTLGDAFARAGFERSAQVDLGSYEHDHRAVGGPTGLSEMSRSVGATLLEVVTDHGVDPDFETLARRYRTVATDFVDAYAADAGFNGLAYDRTDELEQVRTYADAIETPAEARRLPSWSDAPIAPEAVREMARNDLEAAR